MKISFFIALCLQLTISFALAAWPTKVSAQINPQPLQFEPQIQIPNSAFSATSVSVATLDTKTGMFNSDLLAKYIQAFYNYGMAVVGILAAIVLMAGGVLWLTSGGDSGKVGQAKELIIGSIVGTGILFSSWIILNTVNPELLKFKPIKTLSVQQRMFGDTVCCDQDAGEKRFVLTTNKDGKRVYASDPSKLFLGCNDAFGKPEISLGTRECPTSGATTACLYTSDGLLESGTYKCVDTSDICCQCRTTLLGVITSASCYDHAKSMQDCEDWCHLGWGYAIVGIGYQTLDYPGEYTCGSRATYNYCSAPQY